MVWYGIVQISMAQLAFCYLQPNESTGCKEVEVRLTTFGTVTSCVALGDGLPHMLQAVLFLTSHAVSTCMHDTQMALTMSACMHSLMCFVAEHCL